MSCSVLSQIGGAVVYLHEQALLHCWVTSHAIHLVSALTFTAKLGNFEYMIDRYD